MSDDAPPAGWYPNPDGSAGLRWWSGVGWTEYTRDAAPGDVAEAPVAETEVTAQSESEVPVEEPAATAEPTTDQTQWANPWGQHDPTAQIPPVGGFAAYAPPPPSPLTPSGMRPLGGMFSDIGRIVRRAWLPILGISFLIWTVVTVALTAVGLSLVNLDALGRGLNTFGSAIENNPEGNIPDSDVEAMSRAFSEAFSSLSPVGWALIGGLLTLLMILASVIQIAAVSRLSMDAAAEQPVTWGAGWRSGFSGGMRLFGYWLLLALVSVAALFAITAAIALVNLVSTPLAVIAGLVAFIAVVAVAFWLTGRFVPVVSQAIVGRHALRWSWTHTQGKFWAVIGRYLLWSIAASIIIQALSTIVAIPASLLLIGEVSSADSLYSQFGTAMALQVVLLPISAALGSITVLGITPIWRDLTDHPVYRSIDDNGVPIVTQK